MSHHRREEVSFENSSRAASTKQPGSPVLARINQAIDSKVNIRLVPSRGISLSPEALGCQPRNGSDPAAAAQIRFPDGLADKLREANSQVVEWLAKEEANPKRFLEDPVKALAQAGLELSRAEQKALWRAHREAADGHVVPPGVNVTEVSIEAAAKGRVGRARRPSKPDKARDTGCC